MIWATSAVLSRSSGLPWRTSLVVRETGQVGPVPHSRARYRRARLFRRRIRRGWSTAAVRPLRLQADLLDAFADRRGAAVRPRDPWGLHRSCLQFGPPTVGATLAGIESGRALRDGAAPEPADQYRSHKAFGLRHSSMGLDPVTQTPCPGTGSRTPDPHASNGPRNGAGHCGMVPCPAEPEPADHGPNTSP